MKSPCRKLAAALGGAVALALIGTANAAPADPVEDAPLYKWDGTGYTDVQVPFSSLGDPSDIVMIPVEFQDVKHDFRSAWVATIFNLHFGKTSSQEEFIGKYQGVLDNFSAYNMNAMLFQGQAGTGCVVSV